MLKKICCLVLSLFAIFSMTSCFGNSMEDFFADWEVEETDPDIAILDVVYDTLKLEEDVFEDFGGIYTSREFVCIYNNKAYGFLNSYIGGEQFKYTGKIYSRDLKTREIEYLYLGQYCPSDSENAYRPDAYYQDGNIIIFDNVVTTVYNIETAKAEHFAGEDFSKFYNPKYTVERVSIENGGENEGKSVKIVGEDGERVITPEYMAERHKYMQRVIDFGVHKSVFGTVDPMGYSFFNSWFVINDSIYFVCEVGDRDCSPNLIVFRYDYEEDRFTFLYHQFDWYNLTLSVLPVESKKQS